jgi:hypothetical protein
VFAAAAAFIISLTIIWTITFRIDHFGNPALPLGDSVLGAKGAILIFALCAYVVAALFAERRRHEAVLPESEARLQEALTAGAVTAFEWDPRSGLSQRGERSWVLLDSRRSPPPNSSRVHPDDRPRFKGIIYASFCAGGG